MAVAQQARWAKLKGEQAAPLTPAAAPTKTKRKYSAEAKARMAARAKARWAKAKAEPAAKPHGACQAEAEAQCGRTGQHRRGHEGALVQGQCGEGQGEVAVEDGSTKCVAGRPDGALAAPQGENRRNEPILVSNSNFIQAGTPMNTGSLPVFLLSGTECSKLHE